MAGGAVVFDDCFGGRVLDSENSGRFANGFASFLREEDQFAALFEVEVLVRPLFELAGIRRCVSRRRLSESTQVFRRGCHFFFLIYRRELV